MLHPPQVDRIQAVVAYDELARTFLLRAKLGQRPELLRALGQRLARAVEVSRTADGCTCVVPVPSAPWVTLRRGFTPAAELAGPVARRLGLPIRRRALGRRILSGGPVKRLSADRRRALAAKTFRVRGDLAGQRVLLVDDVMTTGATIDGCTRALREAGATWVAAAVWARTTPSIGGV